MPRTAQAPGNANFQGWKTGQMRSSKSRSRSKQNRPRSIGNIINRVFESSGPEGKVRGTPQQIIEKYQTLARDAQLSNDRVAAENFLQHAEHYTRMLAEAQREMAAEQDQRRQHQGGPAGANGNGNGQPQDDRPWQPRRDDRAEDDQPDIGGMVPVFPYEDPRESGLVETPEARSDRPRPAPHGQPRRDDRRSDGARPDQPRPDQPRRDDRRRDDRRRDERKLPEAEATTPPATSDQPVTVSEPAAQPQPAPKPQAARKPRPAPPQADAAPATDEAETSARPARRPRKPKAAPDDGTPPSEAAE